MTDVVLCYSNPSSKTGSALYEALKLNDYFTRVRRVRKNKRIKKTDVFIRWGNSTSNNPTRDCMFLNTAEAVRNASNKKRMIGILSNTEGVNTPQLLTIPAEPHDINEIRGD